MDEIGVRIKEIRKARKRTQQEFANAIGLKRNTIANYEIGQVQPSDRTISDICREFDVNETWLRTGEGEMFLPITRDEEIEDFIGRLLHDESDSFRKRLISVLAKLTENEWKTLEEKAKWLVKCDEEESND